MAANFPFERFTKHVVGLLPNTAQNNRNMLVVIDNYTRWLEAVNLEHQDAHSVTLRLISKIISGYGAPYVIYIAQGTNFESKLNSQLCNLYDIKNAYDAETSTVTGIGGPPQPNTRRHDREYCKRLSRHLGSKNWISVNSYSIRGTINYMVFATRSTVRTRNATTTWHVLRCAAGSLHQRLSKLLTYDKS